MIIVLLMCVCTSLIQFKISNNRSSDHHFHIGVIERIKNNNNKFLTDYFFSVNESNLHYPQFFHWVLSFFPKSIIRDKFYLINIFFKNTEIIFFNCFLFYYYGNGLDNLIILKSNIVFQIFPFSYLLWNAKHGVSPRYLGLVSGQLYLYLLILYISEPQISIIISIYLITFLISISSLFAMQLIILTMPLFCFYFNIYELLFAPFFAFLIFYIINPKLALKNTIGRFNYRKNYALFISEIYILKHRPSIWKDFVYEFWNKLYVERKKIDAIAYIISNPVVEFLYGFPFIFPILYIIYNGTEQTEYLVFYKIIEIVILLFLITTLRVTRFLGEPQRYIEFIIPIITFLFIKNSDFKIQLIFSIFSALIIIIYLIMHNKFEYVKEDGYVVLKNILDDNSEKIVCSNDFQLLKRLMSEGFKVIAFDYTKSYKSKKEFQEQFYNNNREVISPKSINFYINKKESILYLNNNELYSPKKIISNNPNLKAIFKNKKYEVFCK